MARRHRLCQDLRPPDRYAAYPRVCAIFAASRQLHDQNPPGPASAVDHRLMSRSSALDTVRAMRIDILLVRHPADRVSPVIPAMIEHLEEHGATVRRLYPDEGALAAPTPETTDLLILKAKTPAALEVARSAHEAGVR